MTSTDTPDDVSGAVLGLVSLFVRVTIIDVTIIGAPEDALDRRAPTAVSRSR